MHLTHTLPEETWRRFVDEHPQGNIFHTPEMFRVFAGAANHRPTLWAAVNAEEKPLALLLPVQVSLGPWGINRFTTRAVLYGGALCAPRQAGLEALDFLLAAYKRKAGRAVLFTELRNLSDASALQPVLRAQGFAYEEHLNFLIDLQRPAEEIWHDLDGDVRTNVRKALRLGVTVEEATSVEEAVEAWAVLAHVYKRIRVPLAPLSLFRSAFELLYPRGMLKLLIARQEGAWIGVAWRLLYKGVIYAWYAGTRSEYGCSRANELLHWHLIEWGAQNGFAQFDFGGAGKPGEDYGPRRFKAKFRGRMVNYGRNTCIHAPLAFRVSKWAYDLARKF